MLDNCHDGRNLRDDMYRPPSSPPRTAWARHLDNVMRERGWSKVRLFEEVAADLGYSPKSRTAILKFLVDTEPDDEQAAVLARHFGWPSEPAPAPAEATEPTDKLIAALERQAAAMEALTAEMREAREKEQDVASAILAALAVLRPDPTPGGGAASTTRGARAA